ncbi:hypothetical protein [Lolliginicoccus suaedae]|uniref:hypothetical protein n=1 Tax=Lolliginicoccus suaedae TaxID=2605429 RepID=UPI0011EF4F76|nr:hypothetical protein [Lolliginicoccus suaedae]
MANRLRIAHGITWITAILFGLALLGSASTFLVDQDRYGPEGFTDGIHVTAVESDIPLAEVLEALNGAARETAANIYKSAPAVADSVRSTDYYLFTGDPASIIGDPDTDYFPTFGSAYPATLLPGESLGRDQLLGTYLVQGDTGQAREAVRLLRLAGTDAVAFSNTTPAALRWLLSSVAAPPWGIVFAILWTALVLATANLGSTRLNIVGLRLAVGHARLPVLAREAGALAPPAAAAVLIPFAVLLAYSHAFADGYLTATIMQIGAVTLVLVPSATVLSAALLAWATRKYTAGRAIRGARPLGLLAALSMAALALATGGAALGSAQALVQARQFQAATEAYGYHAAHPELVSPAQSYAVLSPEGGVLAEQLGQVHRELEQQGQVWMTDSRTFEAWTEVGVPDIPVLVNSSFLESLPDVPKPLVPEIRACATVPGGICVLIPSRLVQDEEEIIAVVQEWGDFQLSLGADRAVERLSIITFPGVDLGVTPLLDFNRPGAPPFSIDPVLVVTDSSSGILSDDSYSLIGAYTDGARAERELQERGASRIVISWKSIANLAELDHANRVADFRIVVIATAMMAIVFLLSAAIFAAIHHARNTAAIFLLQSVGSGFWRIYGRHLLVVGALSVAPTIAMTFLIDLALAPQLLIIGGISAAALAVTVTTLLLLRRGVNRAALEAA